MTLDRRLTDRYGLAQWGQLGIRLLLIMMLYTLGRIVFYIYNADLLAIDSTETWWRIMLGGLRFDLSAVIYSNLLVIALWLIPHPWRYAPRYRVWIDRLLLICNIPMLILNLGDVAYYRYSARRTSLDVLNEFSNENPLNFTHFLWQFWPITLIVLALSVGLIYALRYLRRLAINGPKSRLGMHYIASTILLAISIVGMIFGMRGSFILVTRPLAPNHAALYIARPEQRAMVLNTPFVMLRTAGKHVLTPLVYMSEDEARALFDPVRLTPAPSAVSGSMRGRNVVVIIWESLAREWSGRLNGHIEGYTGYTPFLDSLMAHSYYYEQAFAGGGKSIDAMPAIFASVPRPQTPFVGTLYSGNSLSSIADATRTAGYSTIFFHNGHNGSMGFDAMAHQLGFEQYRGMTEYGDDRDFDGKWGIWDEPFLQFMARELSTLREPFFAAEFTTTSHEPYQVPQAYEGYFPKGHIPIHQCIGYSDHALQKFFETAKSQPWYQNTLFVITADHAVPGHLSEYKTSEGAFAIPMIFYDPQGKLVGRDAQRVVQQADVLPTLIDLLGLDYPVVAFGHNMFADAEDHFAINSLDGTYQMIRGDYILQHDGEKVIALYNRRLDPKLLHNIATTDSTTLAELLPLMQAYLQSFTQRMINDQMSVKK